MDDEKVAILKSQGSSPGPVLHLRFKALETH